MLQGEFSLKVSLLPSGCASLKPEESGTVGSMCFWQTSVEGGHGLSCNSDHINKNPCFIVDSRLRTLLIAICLLINPAFAARAEDKLVQDRGHSSQSRWCGGASLDASL